MGHHISGVVLCGSYDEECAAAFDLTPVPLERGLVLFPLDPNFTDHWAEKLNEFGNVANIPLLNVRVVHRMVNEIAPEPLFALIEIDYAGGTGSQAAAVYRASNVVMAPVRSAISPVRTSKGPINCALRLLGIKGSWLQDEFEAVGLGRYRNFDYLFEKYGLETDDR